MAYRKSGWQLGWPSTAKPSLADMSVLEETTASGDSWLGAYRHFCKYGKPGKGAMRLATQKMMLVWEAGWIRLENTDAGAARFSITRAGVLAALRGQP